MSTTTVQAVKRSLTESLASPPNVLDYKKKMTGIVCTIGPSTNSKESIKSLLNAGMNVARLNFSHGDYEYHKSIIDNVRAAVAELPGIVCGLMLDTKGPEIRTVRLKPNPETGKREWTLKVGEIFTFHNNVTIVGDQTQVATTYENLPKVVEVGKSILVDDGLIRFTVLKITENEVTTRVENSGVLGENKGVNLPGVTVDLPAVTEKDVKDIAFGVENNVDFIAASFIRKPEDVLQIRALLNMYEDAGKDIMIISKIESQEGLNNFDEILEVSDAIMVARGDLGVEIPIERVTSAQKMIIRKCNKVGKPVITATQMLESMIQFPRPTRAEATDVANAVFDGSDCVMLSGETAKGAYPVEAVKTMAKICIQAEYDIDYRRLYKHILENVTERISVRESVASSAAKCAWDINASVIIGLTETGSTIRSITKYRPECPILACTTKPRVARQLQISRSAFPLLVDDKDDNHKIAEAIADAKARGFCKEGDKAIILTGYISGKTNTTNTIRIITIE